jgi:hypothetical protein
MFESASCSYGDDRAVNLEAKRVSQGAQTQVRWFQNHRPNIGLKP